MDWAEQTMERHHMLPKRMTESEGVVKIETDYFGIKTEVEVFISEGDCLTIKDNIVGLVREDNYGADIHIDDLIYILKRFTTPKLLRMIADEMEK